MAFQSIFNGSPARWGLHYIELANHTANQLNTAGYYVSYNITVPKTGTVDSVAFALGNVPTAQELDVGIYVTGADGAPGSAYGGMVKGTLSGAYSAGVHEVTLGTSATATKGDKISVKVGPFTSTVGDVTMGVYRTQGTADHGFPKVMLYNGAINATSYLPAVCLGYSDGSYPYIHEAIPPSVSAGNLIIDDDGSGAEAIGIKFQVPTALRLSAFGLTNVREFGTVATDTVRMELRDGTGIATVEGTLLASSQSIVDDEHAASSKSFSTEFTTPYELAANTNYRVVVRAEGSRTANFQFQNNMDLGDAAHMEAAFNANTQWTEWDGTTWTDTATRMLGCWLEFDQVDIGSGGGGQALVVPRRRIIYR